MKLYLETKLMTLEDGEHEIVLKANDKEFFGYDRITDSNIIFQNEGGTYIVREQETWWSYPLYEFKNNEITPFDYIKYSYFANTERRMGLALKISELYNQSSELKILRKTLKYIMDELNLNYPDKFSIMDKKINEVIEKNPKDKPK